MATIYKRANTWCGDYTDARGKRVRERLSTDKGVAQMLLGKRLQEVEKLKAGAITSDPREAARPFAEHATDYIDALRRRGRDDQYARQIERRLKHLAETYGWEQLKHVRAQDVRDHLDRLAEKGRTPKTIKGARDEVFSFCKWCVKNSRMEANPVELVERPTDKRDKTRRALTAAEITALLKAAPPSRSLVYAFLVYTGLRRGEAKQLWWAHVHLDGENPHVELPASITKSGRAECVPLVPQLVGPLREAAKGRQPSDPVFSSLPRIYTFRNDLAAAKIPDVDARGRKVVLHSLRHSLATMLAVSGVPMSVAQRMMRHSDIRLTADVYTDEALLPLAAAMRSLPVFSPSNGGIPKWEGVQAGASATGLEESAPGVAESVPTCAEIVSHSSHTGAHPVKVKNKKPLAAAGFTASDGQRGEWAQQDSNL
ncbi:MAG: site-specific integrase [Phycisphaerales bacterium]